MNTHIHRYRRVDIGKDSPHFVMQCIKPGCDHYIAMKTKLSAPLLKGKIAECNRCNDQFILNKRALRMAEPCCDHCIKRRKNLSKADDFFKELEAVIMEE